MTEKWSWLDRLSGSGPQPAFADGAFHEAGFKRLGFFEAFAPAQEMWRLALSD
jgi:hypothetical protein